MKEFNYHRPTKVADAVKFIKKARNGKLMSGGMTLIPTMKQGLANPSDIIDLGGLKNSGVAVSTGKVTIKAGTTHTQVAQSEALKKTLPALATVAGAVGDPHVRNKGT
ncbi:MAG TPA: FAD binding domain-containing protein, partial [Aestuariivirgaceae bacterium]|nr:FAD binding domain-containing protein [Aestuariivirgaceae bacterium]